MKILDFGSINQDLVYHMEHFVQPKETVSALSREVHLGGKGLNQSVAAALAGGEVYLAGNIGREDQQLLDFVQQKGVHTEFVGRTDQPTGHAVIQVDPTGQNCIIIYPGANAAVTLGQIQEVFQAFQPGDILLIQNEVNALKEMIDAGSEKGMKIAFNPSPFEKKLEQLPLEKITWFILNEVEGCGLTGESDPERITEQLLCRYPESRIVLTLGGDGVLYRDAHNRYTHGIYDVPIVDTTAAGDTFTGYFLSATARGESIPRALELASIASSIAVSRAGATPSIPSLQEVLEARLTPVKR